MRSICLNKVTKFSRFLNLRFLDYLPCTCKIPGKDHFWAMTFFFYTDFQIFVALFRTFGMQKDDKIIFVCRCFREQGDMQKGGFQRMV